MNLAAWISRVTLGLIFAWFGLLKLFGVSPVVAVIEQVYPWIIHTPGLYTLLGIFELGLGVGILIPKVTALVGWVMIAHLSFATGGVLISPQSFSNGFPFLSVIGEFVVKNFALMALTFFLICHRRNLHN